MSSGMPRENAKRRSAFTLIELLVVISIIGILITLTVVVAGPIQRKSRDAKRKADVNTMLTGLNLFKTDFKVYPNYTMYLGTNGDVGAKNSNFDLGSDLPACTSLTDGKPNQFTTGFSDYTTATLTPGFATTNYFLICTKYLDRKLTDPKPNSDSDAFDNYGYRVSYDYGDILLSAKLENTNDSDNKRLYDTNALRRYYLGSGMLVRHLDEDSNTSTFFSTLSGNDADGLYLYQCKWDPTPIIVPPLPNGIAITKDNRVGYEPIKANGSGGWTKNPACRDGAADLDVMASE